MDILLQKREKMTKKALKVAITHHYLLSLGGSERVIEALAQIYPQADFFVLFAEEEFIPEKLKGRHITTSSLDRIPGARRIYRHLLPLYPLAVESLDLSGYDLILSADGAATQSDAMVGAHSLRADLAIHADVGFRSSTANRWLHGQFALRLRPNLEILSASQHRHLSTSGHGERLCRIEAR